MPPGGRAVWGQRIECDPVAFAGADPRGCPARPPGRGSSLGLRRASRRADPGSGRGQGRNHPGRAAGGLGPAGCRDQRVEPVPVLRGSPDHAQEKSAHADEQSRPDVLNRRQAWFDGQLDLDPDRLVFIDETGASTKMARRHGRAPRGQRLTSSVPQGHWRPSPSWPVPSPRPTAPMRASSSGSPSSPRTYRPGSSTGASPGA